MNTLNEVFHKKNSFVTRYFKLHKKKKKIVRIDK